jgi:hypothetical protein
MKCGEIFVNFKGQYYVQYRGNAFYVRNGRYVKIPVNSRIMVDVFYFRKINPNYVRPAINKLVRFNLSSSYYYYPVVGGDEVKSNGSDLTLFSKDDLMTCCQTVYGWNFGNKQWRRSPICNTLIVIGPANVMRNEIPNKLYGKNRLEFIFFSQSRDPYRT